MLGSVAVSGGDVRLGGGGGGRRGRGRSVPQVRGNVGGPFGVQSDLVCPVSMWIRTCIRIFELTEPILKSGSAVLVTHVLVAVDVKFVRSGEQSGRVDSGRVFENWWLWLDRPSRRGFGFAFRLSVHEAEGERDE